MPRDFEVYLADMRESVATILEFTRGFDRDSFLADKRTVHAAIRNPEVLGEAAKRIPANVRSTHPAIPWQRIAGLRDILIHQYFDIDPDILWDIASPKIPELAEHLESIHGKAP